MVIVHLTDSRAAFTATPKTALTPHTVAYLKAHRETILNLLLSQRAANEATTGVAICAAPAHGSICGAAGTHRKLDGSWLCQTHGTAWIDALWPPVDPTAATDRCRALSGADAQLVVQ